MVALLGCKLGSSPGLQPLAAPSQTCKVQNVADQNLAATNRLPLRYRKSRPSSSNIFPSQHCSGSAHLLSGKKYASRTQTFTHQKRKQTSGRFVNPRAVLSGPPTPAAPSSDRHAQWDWEENQPPEQPGDKTDSRSHETDVVIVGAGIGGLCCGALLAMYGQRVTICESHSIPGGAAHSFQREGYRFDSGPSFHAGLSMEKSINPLKQVLDLLGEKVPCVSYDTWIGYLPEGRFPFKADAQGYRDEILKHGGPEALAEWMQLEKLIEPLAKASAALPPAAMRGDPAVALSVARFLPGLLPTITSSPKLLRPFSEVVDKCVKNPFLRNLIDLECFVLSGMLAKSTITAEMAFMFYERNRPEGTIDYPIGGGEAIIDALVRGFKKHGGRLLLNSHVEEVVVRDGRAVGVKLRGRGKGPSALIRARKAVVSNASVWDTQRLLPPGTVPEQQRKEALATPQTGSFLHLHLGIDATGLPKDLECHHLIVDSWEAGIHSPQNVCIVSIPTIFDPNLAPEGKHVVHAYTAGNEPYSIWEGMDRSSPEYKALKEERVQCLWKALERVIPDIRQRTELELIGTPLTHERYLRRDRGTYGPAIEAGKQSWPGPVSPLPGLYCCGDSTMPGIGVPAVAASGMITANTMVPIWKHWQLLDNLA